jgi:hypothetical protein
MTDVTQGIGFVGITPCRVADTRGNGAPIQGGIFPDSGLRTWDLTGICGIPAAADAVSVNFTVVPTVAAPAGAFLLAWPTGQAPPPTAIMTYGPGQTIISNAAIVPLGAGEQMQVNVSHSTHVIMDVNGYFTDTYNPGVRFAATISGVGGAVQGRNISSANLAFGVEGSVSTTAAGVSSAGVRGINDGTGSNGIGVWGTHAGGGWGVLGQSATGHGVYGTTAGGAGIAGVRGQNDATGSGGVGVWGSQAGSGWGVFGQAPTGYGVVGKIATDTSDRAGVIGQTGFVTPNPGYFAAGVRGEGRDGVLGVSGNFLGGGEAVVGSLVDGFGAEIRYGSLATSFGVDPSGGAAPWAVFGGGDIGATGAKFFLDPHPTDATKEIAYISLEGPEAGTYFRGRAKFQNGVARIPVPDHFRFVTDPEGLTVQITPIGAMASFAVLKMDLNEIVVQASRNVEFSYLVQGVRSTFKDLSPIRESGDFMPRFANAKIPGWLSPAQKRLLIQNGTYREDGTVNSETAQRLGWDKVWEQRSRPAPQPTTP